MANTKVEVIGNQLSGTIMNAASEATLQEIVRTVNSMNKGMKKSNSPSNNPVENTTSSASPGSILGKAAGAVADQIGNVVGAMGSFAGLMAAGNDKISSYTSVLSNQVLKEIPIFGRVLGVFGDTVSYTIEQFESWNESLKKSSKSGATFNNSILEMRVAAARTYLSLDDFVGIINKNSEFLAGFGGTVTQGAQDFAHYNEVINKQGGVGREIFRQIGYSAKDVSEAQMNFMKNTMRGADRKKLSDEEFNKQFGFYQLNLERLTKLTGITAEQLQEQMAVATQDLQYQREKIRQGPENAAKMDATLAMFTGLYGKAGAELVKATALGMEPFSMEAQILKQSIAVSGQTIQEVMAKAKDANIEVDKFDPILRQAYGKNAEGIIGFVKTNDRMLKVYSQLDGGNNELNRALSGATASYIRFTRDGKTTVENALTAYDAADEEAKKRNPLTKLLNDMALAFDEFKKEFIIALLPYFKRLSDALGKHDISGMLQSFGESLVQLVAITLPTMDLFFRNLQTDKGKEFIKSELEYFFERLTITSKYAFMRAFTKEGEHKERGLTAEHEKTEVDQSKARRVQRAQSLGYTDINADSNFLGAKPLPVQGGIVNGPGGKPDVSGPQQGGAIVTPGGRNVSTATGAVIDAGRTAGLSTPMANMENYVMTSGVGPRNGPNGNFHFGNDIVPKSKNDTDIPIRAIASGIASSSYDKHLPQGNMVKIYHPDADLTSIYMHLSDRGKSAMEAIHGQQVTQDQMIGYMGNTGTNRDGTAIPKHLHFQMTQGDFRSKDFKFNENVLDPKQIYKYNKGTMGQAPSDSAQLSIDQMENIAKNGSDINLQQLISDFNTNMSTLIQLTQERQSLHQEQLSYTRKLSGNLIG